MIPEILPKYVKLGHTELRLIENSKIYYRDAGDWSIMFEEKEGKLFSVGHYYSWLNGVELVPITQEEYEKANLGYL